MARTDLGPVTAYAEAVEHGYTGSREEFAALIANAAEALGGIEELREDLTQKLTEPANIAVGKYFRVSAIDEKGHAVLEAVDLPIANDRFIWGLSRYQYNSGIAAGPNYVHLEKATNAAIANRATLSQTGFGGITSENIVPAVDSVLCSTAANEKLTAEQQLAAKQRLGIYGDYEEYYLHDTLSADSQVDINLPNVSELHCFILLEPGATVGKYGQACLYDSNGTNRGYMTELGNVATAAVSARVGYFNYGIIGDAVQQLRWDATGNTGSLTVKNERIGDVARKAASYKNIRISKIEMPPITGEAYIRILYR